MANNDKQLMFTRNIGIMAHIDAGRQRLLNVSCFTQV